MNTFLVLSLLMGMSASAQERVLDPKLFLIDCTQYLEGTFAHQFKPNEAAPVVSAEALTWQTPSQSISEAQSIAIDRWIDAANSYSEHRAQLGDFAYPTKLSTIARWPLNSAQRTAILSILEKNRALMWKAYKFNPKEERMRLSAEFDEAKALLKRESYVHPDRTYTSPTGIALSTKNKSFRTIGNGDSYNLRNELAATLQSELEKYLGKNSFPASLVRDIREIVIGQIDTEIGMDLSYANEGVIQYWSKQIQNSPTLFTDALNFYSELKALDAKTPGTFPPTATMMIDEKSKSDIWAMAMKSTQEDPIRAMRVLSVYGHDDQLQELQTGFGKHDAWVQLLNSFTPDADSRLYQNRAIPAFHVSEKLVNGFKSLQERREQLLSTRLLKESDLPIASYRSGNYHFLGGAMITSELLLKGYGKKLGIRVAPFVSELLGILYKRLTLESNYLTENEAKLFHAGYPKKPIENLEGLSAQDLEVAKYKLDLNLLHLQLTHEQHRVGADWAYELISPIQSDPRLVGR